MSASISAMPGTLPDALKVIGLFDGGDFGQAVQNDFEIFYGHTAQQLELHQDATLRAGREDIGTQQGDLVRQAMFNVHDAIDTALRHYLSGLESLAFQDDLLL